jgi:nicotinamide-nucleotide amidase
MKAEIISIGSELTSGQNLDSNSQWLSRRLAEIGIAVGWHTTVADDLDDNVEVFRIACRRAGLVLVTGGLGPTQDDLTREALARLAGVELRSHAESLERIRKMFADRGRTMPERNRVQALVPDGAEIVPNDHGTAPGVWMRLGETTVVAMPGVPSEMHAMYEERIKARLERSGLTQGVLIERKLNCFGAGESAVEQRLLDLTRRGHVPEVGITVNDATISLRILARAATSDDARAQIEPIERSIRERLGALVFGADEDDLQHVVVQLLARRRRTLATAEGVTSGLVARRLGEVSGASRWFRGGLVCYDNAAKTELLGLQRALVDEHGAVSASAAESMAVGCRALLRADIAVSTVGVAGPDGLGPDRPAGLVYTAVAWDGGCTSQQFSWLGTRTQVQSRTANLALNQVRLHLLKQV